MENTEIKRNINYEGIRNRNHNVINRIVILIISAGYIFFFLSPYLFHEHPIKQYTELFSGVPFKNGTLVVESWTYSEEQKICEVCCSFNDYGDEDKLEVSASSNYSYDLQGVSALETEILYVDSGYIVTAIYGMPEDWYCAALYINFGEKETNDKLSASVYTCVEDVQKTDKIERKKDNEYKIEHCYRAIERDQQLISDYNKDIENLNTANADYDKQINQLKSKMSLQTTAEKEKSQTQIDSYIFSIKANNDKITKINSEVKLLENDINEYTVIINNLNGVSTETIDATEITQ